MCLCFAIKLCKLIQISKHSKCENIWDLFLISLLNALHELQLCSSQMSNGCLPLFMVMLLQHPSNVENQCMWYIFEIYFISADIDLPTLVMSQGIVFFLLFYYYYYFNYVPSLVVVLIVTIWINLNIFIDREAREIMHLVASVCPSVRPDVCLGVPRAH